MKSFESKMVRNQLLPHKYTLSVIVTVPSRRIDDLRGKPAYRGWFIPQRYTGWR